MLFCAVIAKYTVHQSHYRLRHFNVALFVGEVTQNFHMSALYSTAAGVSDISIVLPS